MRGIGFPASLLAVQLDDELFGHGDLDVLAQLHAERRQLAAVQPVLAGRVVPPLDRAPVGEAASALEEELHPLPAAQPALGIAIPRHPRPPPTPAAASAAGSRRAVSA